jgi:hypothetical protein
MIHVKTQNRYKKQDGRQYSEAARDEELDSSRYSDYNSSQEKQLQRDLWMQEQEETESEGLEEEDETASQAMPFNPPTIGNFEGGEHGVHNSHMS